MSPASPNPRLTPEALYLERKRGELVALESQLAEREQELHTLRNGLVKFEKEYQAVVAEKYEQLEAIQARIAEIAPPATTGSSPAQSADAAAEAPKPPPRRYRPRPRSTPKPAGNDNAPETLKRLYRDVAKALHPDKAETEESREQRHRYMTRANAAYEANDEPRLRLIYEEWEHSPESVKGHGAGPDLVRVIRRIAWCEQRLVLIQMDVQQIQTSGLFGMKLLAEEAAQFERDMLKEMTDRLDVEIAAATEYLARLEAKKSATDGAPMYTDEAEKTRMEEGG
ncbi:MAG: J domain-containing protein [Tepidisphaeraceae bacterium]